MPEDFGQLSEMWGNKSYPGEMNNTAKRLLLFTPDTSFWHTIKECWNNAVLAPVEESTGLKDVTYQYMLNMIQNSV